MPDAQGAFEGRVAIVTGSSRGIGRAIAVQLAEQGADIVVAARREPVPGTIEETAAMVEERGRRALPVDLDVTDEAAVVAMTDETLRRFGRIDMLINNAGTNWSTPVADFPRSRWELVLRVNALGPFVCSKAVLPHMTERGSGHIVNISSIAAVRMRAETSAYTASKAALEGLTGVLAREVQPHGICVNALRVEGNIETPGTTMLLKLNPDRAMWPPEIVAEAVSYICRQPFPFTGQVRTIASLRRFSPRLDEMLRSAGV